MLAAEANRNLHHARHYGDALGIAHDLHRNIVVFRVHDFGQDCRRVVDTLFDI